MGQFFGQFLARRLVGGRKRPVGGSRRPVGRSRKLVGGIIVFESIIVLVRITLEGIVVLVSFYGSIGEVVG